MNTNLETSLITLAFTSWNAPRDMIVEGFPTTNISFHKRPKTTRYIDAGNPFRLFLLHGFVTARGVGTYEF